MRTFLGSHEIGEPTGALWGAEGYAHLLVLVKRHGWPLGILRLVQDPSRVCVSCTDLDHAVREQLGLDPAVGDAGTAAASDGPADLPPISVVVCTRDRPKSLGDCLQALQQLDYPQFEVVVVDNASRTAETAQVVARTPFRFVREERPGLDWARNCGLRAARHEIVAYTDDDARVDPLWLKGLALGFASRQVVGVTGLILPAELETRAQHLFEIYGKDGMSKGFRSLRWCPERMTPLSLIQVHKVGVGANMAFRRSVLDRLGGFDTALDVGTPSCGAGDLDMLHRVLIDGGEIRYEPRALVWHRHRRDMAGLERQLYNNGRAFGVYLIKRWQERRVSRRAILRFVGTIWGPWLAGRVVVGALGRHRLPLRLMWAELRGAVHAPAAYVQTYRHDRRLRQGTVIVESDP